MKVVSVSNPLRVILLLVLGQETQVAAFSPAPKIPLSVALNLQINKISINDNNNHPTKEAYDLGKAFAGVFTGMTLATQVAYASFLPVAQLPGGNVAIPSIVLLRENAATSSTFSLSDTFSTMDFSMPSYNDALSGPSVKAPPSFNPFGSSDSSEDADSDKAAEKEAAAERRAAENDRKAAEKAAAEQAKADAKVAVEQAKADKAARRAAELQKQKEAVDRAAAKSQEPAAVVVPAFSAPAIPEFKAPEVPAFKAPDMPKFDMPKFDMPDTSKFSMPKMDVPKFDVKTSDVPAFKAPEFKTPDMPKIDMPAFSMPDTSKFSMPKLNMNVPAMPEYNLDTSRAATSSKPSTPSFSAPSFSGFGQSSSSTKTSDELIEPQEVRDDRAREGRQDFLQADKEAKAIEAQAKAVRAIADDKRKVANTLKDDACKTHWGGKILCLRPFNSGY